jgi:flagella synthesis protein FlgN
MAERSIAEILKAQENILDELFVVIADEFEVLKARKALDLTAITEKKSNLLLELQSNDSALKYHSEKERLETDFLTQRKVITKKLAELQQKNDVNGRLIELNLTASRRLAASLVQLRDRSTMTYDCKGNQNALRGKHMNFEA